jgi:hypothetical protein
LGINPYPVTLYPLVGIIKERQLRVERIFGGPS